MIYKIENKFLIVRVNEEGAELWSIYHKGEEKEYLWQGNPEIWELRAPTIFPYCGRIKDFTFIDTDGRKYEGMNHGFSRFSHHTLVSLTENKIEFNLPWTNETLKKYPYQFNLNTTYELVDKKLSCQYEVTNKDTRVMPFNVGYHPGFICPFSNEYDIDDYVLEFEQLESPIQIVTDSEGQLRTGEEKVYFQNKREIQLKDGMFPKNICLRGLKSEYINILEKPTGRYVRVYIKGFPNVVLWSKPGKIHFICIEPWKGLPDDEQSDYNLFNKKDIQLLQPGETYKTEMQIELGNK